MRVDWYDRLQVEKVINGLGTSTGAGGGLMPPEVREAMEDAAGSYVRLEELQKQAGKYIAELTNNEACYVCAGSSSGLLFAAAVCMTGNDPGKIRRLPDTTGMPDEFIIHRTHVNVYTRIIPISGGKLTEVGYARGTAPWQLEDAITEDTAAILYIFYRQGWRVEESALSLPETIRIAHRHDLPVIVDAAGQLPPKENLWKFTDMGADLVVFSGGKGLKGPQSSGLILGRPDLIEACRELGPPNHNLGRACKVPKEEIVGLTAAVERYLKLDLDAEMARIDQMVRNMADGLSEVEGLNAYRRMPGDSGEPYPFCELRMHGEDSAERRDALVSALQRWDPPILVSSILRDRISINALTLSAGEDEVVVRAIAEMAPNLDLQ